MSSIVMSNGDKLDNRTKEIYGTLDVFSHGDSHHHHKGDETDDIDNLPEVHETSHADYELTVQSNILTVVSEEEDQDNNNINQNDISQHDMLTLQTGAKLYHGDGSHAVTIAEEKEDEVEESIKRFIAVPTVDTFSLHTKPNTDTVREVECFLWYPDDSRRRVCEEALHYLHRELECHQLRLQQDTVDLSRFNVGFPVLIFCLPPQGKPSRISLGEMSVALVIIHGTPGFSGSSVVPLADDLYWRRYPNLSLIVDLRNANGIFQSSGANSACVYRLAEFFKNPS